MSQGALEVIYYPYFRGKQYELLCIKENAELLSASGFCPIIEPVKDDAGSIVRCLAEIVKYDGSAFVVANPSCGGLKDGLSADFKRRLAELIGENNGLSWMYRTQGLVEGSVGLGHGTHALLHDRSQDAAIIKSAAEKKGARLSPNVFIEGKDSGPLYRRQFSESVRIIVQDGFRKKKNSDYLEPHTEHFSDLYLTYKDLGMDGFGDFLTVGEEFSEGGGPAYAVAIHLTFVDDESNSSVFIKHFVSDSNLTPADPAGKFGEALAKLSKAVRARGSKILQTAAVKEFLSLYDRGHYPGLGYVKKLSMQHHIELMASLDYD